MDDKDIDDVDLVVIGGGKAGKSLAMDRAKAGWKVVMVERDKIGGTCINVACIPTKALVGSARSLLAARHAAALGVKIDGEATIDLERLREHKEGVVGGMVAAHTTMSPPPAWTSSWAPRGSSPPAPWRSLRGTAAHGGSAAATSSSTPAPPPPCRTFPASPRRTCGTRRPSCAWSACRSHC